MAFTGSDIPVSLVELDEIFYGETMLSKKANWPVGTISAIAENQSVRTEPLSPNDPCTEVDAWFYRSGASNLVHSRTTPDATIGCDLATGPELATDKQRYANNYNIKSSFKIEAARCNNASDGRREMARGLADSMSTNRRNFNNAHAIALLGNSVQADVSGQAASYGFDTRVDSTLLKMPPANFNYEGLRGLELLAMANQFTDPVIVSGSAFYRNADLVSYLGLDDDKRSQAAAFQDSSIYFDPMNLDRAVTANLSIAAPTAFIFDPSIFLVWSTQLYDTTVMTGEGTPGGMATDPSNNYYTFSVADPVLQYNDNGVMRPFYHNVEAKFECLRRNPKSDKLEYGWTVNVTLSGGLHKAPDGFNFPFDDSAGSATLTGVIGIVAEA